MSENYTDFILSRVLSYFFFSVYSTDATGGNLHNNDTYHGQSTGKSSLPLEAMIVGSSLLALLCLSGALWFAFRYRRKSR